MLDVTHFIGNYSLNNKKDVTLQAENRVYIPSDTAFRQLSVSE